MSCRMFMAKSAVNTFRADAANQVNDVIMGKDAGATVERKETGGRSSATCGVGGGYRAAT